MSGMARGGVYSRSHPPPRALFKESYDELCKAVNVTYEQTQQVNETAKIVGVSRWEVLGALGFSDEWAFVFDDD